MGVVAGVEPKEKKVGGFGFGPTGVGVGDFESNAENGYRDFGPDASAITLSSDFLESESASLGLEAPKGLVPPNMFVGAPVDDGAPLSAFAPNSGAAVVLCEPKVNPPPGGFHEKPDELDELDFSGEGDSDGLAPKLKEGMVVEEVDDAPDAPVPKENPPTGGFGMVKAGGAGADEVVVLDSAGLADFAAGGFISTSVDVGAFAFASISLQCLV